VEKSLSKSEHVRNILKGEVMHAGIKNCWVLDGVGALIGYGSGTGEHTGTGPDYGTGAGRDGASGRLRALRPALAGDGVHLTPIGCNRLLTGIFSAVKKLRDKKSGTGTVNQGKNPGFYWRGFLSPVGSKERAQPTPAAGGHGSRGQRGGRRGGLHHPYGRGGGPSGH